MTPPIDWADGHSKVARPNDRWPIYRWHMPSTPIDPATSPRWALAGRVVTMDAASTVVADGVVWIGDADIAAITERGDSEPAGFDGVEPLETGGTIFPGLMDLHNHIAYNALPLWQVPKRFTNRDQWGNSDEYHRLVTAPMKTIGEATELLAPLVRYVEVKQLVGGVTTTQGIALFSAPGIRRYYRGIVRNVEETGERELPEAGSRIADVDAKDARRFLAAIERRRCYLLHLSEGTDEAAHEHFEALDIEGDDWAIAPSLAGIHCAALKPPDFQVMAGRGASMIWSPFSNLLLYGQTADVADAKRAGEAAAPFKVGLGSDWTPSGSKSLFGELKVARVYSDNNGGVFSDEELVRLTTSNAAEILGWQARVGSVEVGKRADLVAVAGTDDANPYAPLFAGDERTIQLVVINGTPRYGTPALMATDGPHLEKLRVGGDERVLYLEQAAEIVGVAGLSYRHAHAQLREALEHIKDIRLEQEAANAPKLLAAAPRVEEGHPRLALDEFEQTGSVQRPHLSLAGALTGPTDRPEAAAAAAPLSSLLKPIRLDALTVADDDTFLERVAAQINLPDYVEPGLRQLYGQ
jgi:5-methylthioadenosine/S-adenosylhomocysteine deaminase